MELSYWERESFFSGIDIIIIGSGIVGLNAALELKRKHPLLRITVLERGMLPMGASSRNAGFACFGSPSELLSDLSQHSEEKVFSLVRKRYEGLLKLRENLGDGAIDFHKFGGYEVFDDEKKFQEAADNLASLNRQIERATGLENVYKIADRNIAHFGFKGFRHMIVNSAEGQIDTGKMMTVLLKKVSEAGIDVINSFEVFNISEDGDKVLIKSKIGVEIRCKKVIVATNGFARQLLPEYPVMPARAQVLITTPVQNLKMKGTFHYDGGFYYFRNVGNRVLLGGGRNLDFKREETMEFGLTELVQQKLDEMLIGRIVPYAHTTVEMRWSGIMGVGPEKSSIVKAVSANVFCAVRMGGMGVAIGTLVGQEAAELVSSSL